MRYLLVISLVLLPLSAFAADFTLHPDWSVSLPASWGATITAGSARDVLANYPKLRAALKDSCQRRWTREEQAKVITSKQALKDQQSRQAAYQDSLLLYESRIVGWNYRKAQFDKAYVGWLALSPLEQAIVPEPTFTEAPPVKPEWTEVPLTPYTAVPYPKWMQE